METLWIVVPCYNEQEVIEKTCFALCEKLETMISMGGSIAENSKVCFVDDGSIDSTWKILESLSGKWSNRIVSIKMSRNNGHQNALMAGLMYAKNWADIVISMDADLQDDIDTIDCMVEEYKKGNEIVYGVRNNRESDSFFKRKTAELFYTVAKKCGVELVANSADFRLMSKKVLVCLEEYQEVNLFLRGIVPLLGFRSSCVYYRRNKRMAGESKYPLKKMVHFAIDGITSFSIYPIKLITRMGLVFCLIGALVILWNIYCKINGNVVQGWTSIVASIWLIGGVQICAIGVLGEYIGKIYMETKHRPRYFYEKIINKEE